MNKTNIFDFLKILYVDYGNDLKPKLFELHSHTFWQIEFIISGTPDLELPTQKKRIRLSAGNIAVIPPGHVHRFDYFAKPRESWSFKFSCRSKLNLQSFVISNDFQSLILRDTLIKLASMEHDVNRSLPAALTLTALLAGHCFSKYSEEDKPESTCELAGKIDVLLNRLGRLRSTVENLARHLAYSPNYLSFLFKEETGMTLKKYIDRRICKMAEHHLEYSDYTIDEIAARMQFPDRYAFSHFFKRVCGCSPAEFRRNVR